MTVFPKKPPATVPAASGISILLQSRPARLLARCWRGLNQCLRPMLPILHLCMLAATAAILLGALFCNRHKPCWYDEICMLDPAWHRTVDGIWHSTAQWDSLETIPFAPNYPLFINLLRLSIALFGMDFRIIRGMMFALGLAPIAFLLGYFRKKGFYRSRAEVLQAAFSCACFTSFQFAVFVRPEAVLLCVAALLVYAWTSDRPAMLFLSALCVPLCGLHWNVLLLPVVLHWLLFGGSLRKPLLAVSAFALSTVATLVAYHALGMWPSYLQEAARVGGLDALHNACAKLHGAFARRDWHFLTTPIPPYDALAGNLVFASGALAALCGELDAKARKTWLFSCISYYGIILAIGFLGTFNGQYIKLLLCAPAMLAPCLFRTAWQKFPLLLLAFTLVLCQIAHVHWNQLKHAAMSDERTLCWVDEAALERIFASHLTADDVVCCSDSAYFAARSHVRDVMPLVFAFDFSPKQARSMTALLLQDEPYRIYDYGWTGFRKASFTETLQSLFWDPSPSESIDLWDYTISSDALLDTIGAHWHCSFTEVPLDPPARPGFIRFRLFRPRFTEPFDDAQGNGNGRVRTQDRREHDDAMLRERKRN